MNLEFIRVVFRVQAPIPEAVPDLIWILTSERDKSSQARGQGELSPRQNLLYTFRTTPPPLHQGFSPPEGPPKQQGL